MLRLIIVAGSAIGLILFAAYVISRLALSRTRGLSVRLQVFLALAAIIGSFAFGLGLIVVDRIESRAARLAIRSAGAEAKVVSAMIQSEILRTGLSFREVADALAKQRAAGLEIDFRLTAPDGSVLLAPGTRFFVDEQVEVTAPVEVHDQAVGSVTVAGETVAVRRLLASLAPVVLTISLILGAAAALAASWIGRAIARPIEQLTLFSKRVSEGERAASPPQVTGREMRELSASLDSMRRQLEGRPFVETFAADLSHELKNPVAAIRASAEILEEGALEEPEEARRFVARIRESTARIERLLKDLLSLARIEARGAEGLARLDMAHLVRQVARASDPQGRVSVTSRGDCLVRADRDWLGRAISNLVENAVVHSRAATPISVSVENHRGIVVLSICNEGVVATQQTRRIFRRFVTTRQDRGGTGLGLSIVTAVAEAHGGTVRLKQPGPPSVEFRLELPVASRDALGRRA